MFYIYSIPTLVPHAPHAAHPPTATYMGKITTEVSPPDATPIPPPTLSFYSRIGVLLVTGPMHYFTILGINDFYSGDLHVAFWSWFGVYAVVWLVVFLVSIASLIAYRRSTRELEEKMQQQQELAKCTNPVFRSDVV